jgi:hypothetical protein
METFLLSGIPCSEAMKLLSQSNALFDVEIQHYELEAYNLAKDSLYEITGMFCCFGVCL